MKIINRTTAIPMSRPSVFSDTRSQNPIGQTYSQWNSRGIGKHMSQISLHTGNRYYCWTTYISFSSYKYIHNT